MEFDTKEEALSCMLDIVNTIIHFIYLTLEERYSIEN